MQDEAGRSERDTALNQGCFCITLERPILEASLRREAPDARLVDALLAERPHLFSNSPVFVSRGDLAAMASVVEAVEAAAGTPAYRARVLRGSPDIARPDFGPRGVFMGYDFHVGDDGPRLIEVNTNAGGAFLNALLARAQSDCCREAREALPAGVGGFESAVWEMFLAEWALQGRSGRPRLIAIVDDNPGEQYLYPEFLLVKSLFERCGVDAVIADPTELEYAHGVLSHRGRPVDLVYNRLVDFAFEAEAHRALRNAYLAGAAVVTPSPHNHALLADKRNLALLSDANAVGSFGLADRHQHALAAIPRTVLVSADNAEALWAERKRLFFKPSGGHGGKAVYRGDKITRGAWAHVTGGGYIAQAIAPPSERRVRLDGEVVSLKLDVRLYTYGAKPLLAAARVYQGQTTNFRTPGGGFAPVYAV
ncbi:hypothetical protein [Brevundimonas sp.]|uniref:hypothetical protein n=1 Tax=Brevundimonas sp. TaxID=1871086 RepID=UPI00273787B5|nr:hypothetical protein [Brevundimonas sp.]MDP3801802.1 hypothetical protein [Brevundimonas sp.]